MAAIVCSSCARPLRCPESLVGIEVRCPACGTVNLVPAAPAEAETVAPAEAASADEQPTRWPTPPELRQDSILDRFDRAWREGQNPDLDDYLPSPGSPDRPAVLQGLVYIDLERRLERGEPVRVEHYRDRYPELVEEHRLLELLTWECDLRRRLAPGLCAEEYTRRFPQLASELNRRLAGPVIPLGKGEPAAPTPPPGYEILGELGRGGMGVVYKARQIKLNRLCALKMILSGEHAGPEALARFQTEAEAIARLQHPNIVAVYEVGEHEGRPFFSLEYCSDGSLDKKLAGTPLPPHEAARLVELLARAMHAAHQAQVIHRDLKPANVLLQEEKNLPPRRKDAKGERKESQGERGREDNSPSSPGALPLRLGVLAGDSSLSPKITDFGLARKLDDPGAAQTQTGAIMGTPSYMAPEQAGGKSREIGPACDIYALGVILYECLTGKPPFRAATPLDTILQVVSDEPVPPTQLQSKTPRDLETICLKCLRKEPAKRYQSASELSDDLLRFQNDEPISARPPSRRERFARWCRKNPWRAAGLFVSSVLFASCVALLLLTLSKADALATALDDSRSATARADREARSAEHSAQMARENESKALDAKDRLAGFAYAANLSGALAEWQLHNTHRARQMLEDCPHELRGWEWDLLRRWFDYNALVLRGHGGGVLGAVVSPDGRRVFTISGDSTVRVWNARSGAELLLISQQAHRLALSPDGKTLALAVGRNVLLLDAATGRELRRIGQNAPVCALGFVRGGNLGVVDLGGWVTFFDPASGEERSRLEKRLELDPQTRVLAQLGQGAVFSPDGKRLAQGGTDARVRVWDLATGDLILDGAGHLKFAGQVAFSPDGKWLASPGGEGGVFIWDLESKKVVRTLRGHRAWVWAVAWSQDGARLISGSKDTTARVWNPRTGELLLTLDGHGSEVFAVTYGPGRLAVSSSPDQSARLWDTADRVIYAEHVRRWFTQRKLPDFGNEGKLEHLTFYGHLAACGSVALSPDGRLAATSAIGGDEAAHQVAVWDMESRREVMKVEPRRAFQALAFTPSGRLLVGTGSGRAGEPSRLTLYEAPAGKQVWQWTGPPCLCAYPAFSPDGRNLAVVLTNSSSILGALGKDNTDLLVLLDPATGKERTRRPLPGKSSPAAFSADGRELVLLDSTSRKVHVYDSGGKPLREWVASSSGLTAVAVSRAGVVATADGKAIISLWKLADGTKLRQLEGHVGQVMSLAFSPDGIRLFSGATDFTARLWHVGSGHTLLVFRDHADVPWQGAWSGDGRLLATAERGGALRIWQGGRPETSDAADSWPVLFRDSFDRSTPGPKWAPQAGPPWTIRDGALVGRQVMSTSGVRFAVAQVALKGVALPRQVEVRFRFRASKPMVVNAMLSDATATKVIYQPLLCGKCRLPDSPAALLLQATLPGGKAENTRFTGIGVARKFDMAADRWYSVRLRRDPERLRLAVDGVPLLDERIPRIDLPSLALQGSWSDPGDEVSFADLEIRAPAAAIREQQLSAKAQSLFAKVLLRSEVVRRLAAESPEDRPTVERIVEEFTEDPIRLAEEAWQTAVMPNEPAEHYSLALRQAEAAVKARPNDFDALGTLALCRLRQKDHPGAIRDAQRAMAMARQQEGAAWPSHHAVLAMAYHRLGKTAEARQHFRKLRDLMLCDLWEERGVARQLARETRTLLGPPPAEDTQRDAITQTIVRATQDGWRKHDVESYLKLFTDDATVNDRRSEAPGPYDLSLMRKQWEPIRHVQFRGPMSEAHNSVEDVHVEIKGNEAVWRGRWTIHFRTGFVAWIAVLRLRRTDEGWKVYADSSWPVAERMDGVARTFDDAAWAALDAAADALKDSPDAQKRIEALRAAHRKSEALDVARKATEKPGAPAQLWMLRGELALQLGRLDEAWTAMRTAERIDPTIPLPWEATRLRRIFRGHGGQSVGGAEYLPDGKHIFSCGADKLGRLWNAGTGREIRSYKGASGGLTGAALSPDGKTCAGGGLAISLWELESGKLLATCQGHTAAVYRLHFRHDGKRLLSASHDKTARVWDASTGKELLRLEGHSDAVLGAVFSPDGRFIATCSHDSMVRLWNAESGKPIRTYVGHTGQVKRVVFSRDGERLATCGQDRTIRLWDVKTGKQLQQLEGHDQGLDAVCFSADGKELASSDFDGRVCVWNLESGKRRLVLRTWRGAIYTLMFSPDGRRLAGAGQDGVYVWSIAADPMAD